MRASFTLLHGTWARNAPWTRDDSAMCRYLKARFGEATQIHGLNWGGWNRVSSRTRGARVLADHVAKLPLASDERHFVIAHSHGGNVAMLALNDVAAAARVAGIATLATPFLVAGDRRWSDSLESARLTLLVPPSLLIVALAAAAGSRLGGWLGWLAFACLAVLGILGLRALVLAWARFAAATTEQMRFGPIDRERLLILRSPGDEASVILLASRALLAIGLALLNLLNRPGLRLSALLRRGREQPLFGWAFGVAVFAIWLAVTWLAGVAIEQRQPWHMLLLGLSIAIAVLLVMPVGFSAFDSDPALVMMTWSWLLAAAMLLVAVMPSLLLIVYGWQLAVANIAVDVSAEATPLGEWQVVTLPTEHAFGQAVAPVLTHSALYDSPSALQRIGDWVQSVLDAEAGR